MKAKYLFLPLALFASSAFAGNFNGTITSIGSKASGLFYVTMSGSTGHGACSGASTYWAVKDETTAAGKDQIAILLSAFATGRTVTVYGVNTCTRSAGIEDIDEVAAF